MPKQKPTSRVVELTLALGVEDKADDEPVETQDFAKDEDENHANKDLALVHIATHAVVTDHADAVTCSESGKPDRQARCEMREAGEESVRRAAPGSRQVLGDKDRDDERIDGNDTRHDDRNQALHDKIRAEGADTANADAGLGGAKGRPSAWLESAGLAHTRWATGMRTSENHGKRDASHSDERGECRRLDAGIHRGVVAPDSVGSLIALVVSRKAQCRGRRRWGEGR
jgi:hypothetical protein